MSSALATAAAAESANPWLGWRLTQTDTTAVAGG